RCQKPEPCHCPGSDTYLTPETRNLKPALSLLLLLLRRWLVRANGRQLRTRQVGRERRAGNAGVAQRPDPFNRGFDRFTGFQVPLARAALEGAGRGAAGRAAVDHVAWMERDDRRSVLDQLPDVVNHVAGLCLLHLDAVDRELLVQPL